MLVILVSLFVRLPGRLHSLVVSVPRVEFFFVGSLCVVYVSSSNSRSPILRTALFFFFFFLSFFSFSYLIPVSDSSGSLY